MIPIQVTASRFFVLLLVLVIVLVIVDISGKSGVFDYAHEHGQEHDDIPFLKPVS